jgi:hypothetical protein
MVRPKLREQLWRQCQNIIRRSNAGEPVAHIARAIRANPKEVERALRFACDFMRERHDYPHSRDAQEQIIKRYRGGDSIGLIASTTFWGAEQIRAMLHDRGVIRTRRKQECEAAE